MPEGDDDDEEDNVYNDDDNDDRRGRLVSTRDGYDVGRGWEVGERRRGAKQEQQCLMASVATTLLLPTR